jgi:hypothetical protein
MHRILAVDRGAPRKSKAAHRQFSHYVAACVSAAVLVLA